MNTVMARYRELGSTLEASVQVRNEFQEKGQQHWHRLYERCWCGHLTVPVKYYTYDAKGIQTNTQAQAEKAYLATLNRTQPEIVQTRTVRPSRPAARVCRVCAGEVEGRATYCSQACQKKAYRERSK